MHGDRLWCRWKKVLISVERDHFSLDIANAGWPKLDDVTIDVCAYLCSLNEPEVVHLLSNLGIIFDSLFCVFYMCYCRREGLILKLHFVDQYWRLWWGERLSRSTACFCRVHEMQHEENTPVWVLHAADEKHCSGRTVRLHYPDPGPNSGSPALTWHWWW